MQVIVQAERGVAVVDINNEPNCNMIITAPNGETYKQHSRPTKASVVSEGVISFLNLHGISYTDFIKRTTKAIEDLICPEELKRPKNGYYEPSYYGVPSAYNAHRQRSRRAPASE